MIMFLINNTYYIKSKSMDEIKEIIRFHKKHHLPLEVESSNPNEVVFMDLDNKDITIKEFMEVSDV